MAPTRNATVLFNEIPSGFPVPGKTTVYDTTGTIDLDNVPLNGGVLVKTLALSIDPYQRGNMRDESVESYLPAYKLGKPINNLGVGRVIRSENSSIKAGDTVAGIIEFSEYSIIPADGYLQVLPADTKLPLTAFLGPAGLAGQTAYFAYKEFAKAKKGETIFVSTGAGGVGSMVIQLAKLDGLKVIASAGSDEKVAFMKEIGADVAFNYKTTNTLDVLTKEGHIDIFWDNVGGEALDAALENINKDGRIIACGMISSYNNTDGYTYKNLWKIFAKTLTINGFLWRDLVPKWSGPFFSEIPAKLESGEIQYREEVTLGLENAGEAMRRIQMGENTAKSVVKVAE